MNLLIHCKQMILPFRTMVTLVRLAYSFMTLRAVKLYDLLDYPARFASTPDGAFILNAYQQKPEGPTCPATGS